MIKYSHIKNPLLLLWLSIACFSMSCNLTHDNDITITVYHYPAEKTQVEALQNWVSENEHIVCSDFDQDHLRINAVEVGNTQQVQQTLLEKLQVENEIWAVNSTELLQFDLLQTKQNHFVDKDKMMESVLASICDPSIDHTVSIVFNLKWSSSSEYNTVEASEVPQFDEEKLYEEAQLTFWKFAEAQNLIANEKNDPIIQELISNTIELFVSDQNIVQIQNAHDNAPIEITTEQYLHRMHSLNRYDQIQVDWNQDLKVVMPWESQATERPLSKSRVSGRQKFIGYRSGKISYTDQIDKTIDLHAKLVESIDITGNTVLEWHVFLGDIRVSSDPTTSIPLQT